MLNDAKLQVCVCKQVCHTHRNDVKLQVCSKCATHVADRLTLLTQHLVPYATQQCVCFSRKSLAMLMFSISMLNVSPPPPPPLWQVRRQLAATILLTVPSPNLGLCAHKRGGGAQKVHVQIVVRRRRRRRRNKGSGVFLQPVTYQLLLRFGFGCVY